MLKLSYSYNVGGRDKKWNQKEKVHECWNWTVSIITTVFWRGRSIYKCSYICDLGILTKWVFCNLPCIQGLWNLREIRRQPKVDSHWTTHSKHIWCFYMTCVYYTLRKQLWTGQSKILNSWNLLPISKDSLATIEYNKLEILQAWLFRIIVASVKEMK